MFVAGCHSPIDTVHIESMMKKKGSDNMVIATQMLNCERITTCLTPPSASHVVGKTPCIFF